jgi:hypothetical protein
MRSSLTFSRLLCHYIKSTAYAFLDRLDLVGYLSQIKVASRPVIPSRR